MRYPECQGAGGSSAQRAGHRHACDENAVVLVWAPRIWCKCLLNRVGPDILCTYPAAGAWRGGGVCGAVPALWERGRTPQRFSAWTLRELSGIGSVSMIDVYGEEDTTSGD